MINRRFYQMWRKRVETAASAARLARGSEAIAEDQIVVTEESDDLSCQCDYDGWRCSECKDYRRRTHEDLKQVNRRHKCQCRYTLLLVAKSADGEYMTGLGGVCVDSLNDGYLEYCSAELAAQLLYEMRPTPDSWMAL